MKLLRPISLLAGLLMTMAGATAQISLTPPAAQPPASPPAAKGGAQAKGSDGCEKARRDTDADTATPPRPR